MRKAKQPKAGSPTDYHALYICLNTQIKACVRQFAAARRQRGYEAKYLRLVGATADAIEQLQVAMEQAEELYIRQGELMAVPGKEP